MQFKWSYSCKRAQKKYTPCLQPIGVMGDRNQQQHAKKTTFFSAVQSWLRTLLESLVTNKTTEVWLISTQVSFYQVVYIYTCSGVQVPNNTKVKKGEIRLLKLYTLNFFVKTGFWHVAYTVCLYCNKAWTTWSQQCVLSTHVAVQPSHQYEQSPCHYELSALHLSANPNHK